MIAFIKRLFCKHYKVTFIRNVYGDEINYRNCRSLWRCVKCGATHQRMGRHGANDGGTEMTNHTDLIARLRDTASRGVSVWGDLQMGAADALQSAQAEIEKLREVWLEDGVRASEDRGDLLKERDQALAEIDMHMRVATNAIDHVVTLKAEIEAQQHRIQALWMERDVMRAERDKALARLAKLTKQEPVMVYDGRCIWDCGDGGHQDVTMLKMIAKGTKLYAAAGASPVQPAQSEKELRHRIRVHLTNRNYYSHQEFCTKLEELMAEGAAPSIKLTKE